MQGSRVKVSGVTEADDGWRPPRSHHSWSMPRCSADHNVALVSVKGFSIAKALCRGQVQSALPTTLVGCTSQNDLEAIGQEWNGTCCIMPLPEFQHTFASLQWLWLAVSDWPLCMIGGSKGMQGSRVEQSKISLVPQASNRALRTSQSDQPQSCVLPFPSLAVEPAIWHSGPCLETRSEWQRQATRPRAQSSHLSQARGAKSNTI